MIPNIRHSSRYCKRYSRLTKFESFSLNQLVYRCVYIYFYHRTLGALPHKLPTLEAGTGSRISARFMAPGHETPRARRGDAPRVGGRGPRPSYDVCAEPLRLESSPESRGVPSSGAGPSQNGTCSGVASVGKAGP